MLAIENIVKITECNMRKLLTSIHFQPTLAWYTKHVQLHDKQFSLKVIAIKSFLTWIYILHNIPLGLRVVTSSLTVLYFAQLNSQVNWYSSILLQSTVWAFGKNSRPECGCPQWKREYDEWDRRAQRCKSMTVQLVHHLLSKWKQTCRNSMGVTLCYS